MSRFEIDRRILIVMTTAVALTPWTEVASAQPLEPETNDVAVAMEQSVDYRVLATNKTSTMHRELNEAAAEGFRLQAVMGGETAFGGKEVVVIVGRHERPGRYRYRLLATNKTSTMQRELQDAAADGYHYRSQTVFHTAFGGEEVVVILGRDDAAVQPPSEYYLLATSRTSTLQKELRAAAEQGYELVGLTVGETALGGKETVAITRRPLGGPLASERSR